MSFIYTAEQIIARKKTVTRRMGWKNLKVGETVRAVKKVMGFRKGEKIQSLALIRIADVRREKLRLLADDLDYGLAECKLEGFGDFDDCKWPSFFMEKFCETHKGCTLDTEVTRIQFEYVD